MVNYMRVTHARLLMGVHLINKSQRDPLEIFDHHERNA